MPSVILNKASLLQRLREHKQQLMLFGVKHLGIFGSFAKDHVRETSDVDFLVEFEQERKTYDNFMDLSFYLENLTGRKVELVTPQSLSKYIGPHILTEVEYVL